MLESHQTPYNSPSRGVFFEDWPRYNGTALYLDDDGDGKTFDLKAT